MKVIANKEIFVIIFTVGTLLFGNVYLTAGSRHERMYQAAITAVSTGIVYPSCQ